MNVTFYIGIRYNLSLLIAFFNYILYATQYSKTLKASANKNTILVFGFQTFYVLCHEKMDHEQSFWVANTGTVSNCNYADWDFIRRSLFHWIKFQTWFSRICWQSVPHTTTKCMTYLTFSKYSSNILCICSVTLSPPAILCSLRAVGIKELISSSHGEPKVKQKVLINILKEWKYLYL